MMAASVKDGEALVDLLLSKGADVNITSKRYPALRHTTRYSNLL